MHDDHDRFEWVDLNDILKFKMAPTDIPLIDLYDKKRNHK